jgi:acetyl esterase
MMRRTVASAPRDRAVAAEEVPMTTTSAAGRGTLPGRLGDPASTLRSDPRSDPRTVAALAPFGLDGSAAPPPVGPDSPRAEQLEYAMGAEAGFEAVFAALMQGLPPVEGVERSTETITGPAGNDILLYISRPAGTTGPLPGVLHIHGGGMVILQGSGPAYVRFRDELSATGLVVVGVEYRNGAGVLGPHPFPAGLDDCAAALAWVHEHRADLGIDRLTVAGESGGANLTLATAIRAKREGVLDRIDGVYAMVPYISGMYGRSEEERRAELPSLVENDGYFIGADACAVLARVYDPEGAHATDPLCWPYHATTDDLADLPPHVISVNEIDPLRDEGLAYHRKLVAAGVDARVRTVPGACHAADLMFRGAAPDMYAATVSDVHDFVAGR